MCPMFRIKQQKMTTSKQRTTKNDANLYRQTGPEHKKSGAMRRRTNRSGL
jgi:hypothetical protein